MLEFFRRLFAPEPRSSDTAKERLRLVLLSDHLSLAPEVVEALKRDLLAVISRYLEIDPALADVTFEQRDREVAMLASIPIMGVRERSASSAAYSVPSAPPEPPTPSTPPTPPEAATEPLEPAEPAQPEDESIMEPAVPQDSAQPGEPASGAPTAAIEPRVEALQAVESHAAPAQPLSASARRRRRKKAAQLAHPPHGHGAAGFEPA